MADMDEVAVGLGKESIDPRASGTLDRKGINPNTLFDIFVGNRVRGRTI